MTNEEKKETPVLNIIIPQCCREGLPSCTHVPKKQRQAKINIGL